MPSRQWRWFEVAWTVWVAFLLLAAWLAIYPGWPAVGRLLADPGAPAWVQAIGGLLTIGGAFAVMQLQLNSQRNAEVEKSRQQRVHFLHAILVTLSIVEIDVRAMARLADSPYWRRRASLILQGCIAEIERIDPYAVPSQTLMFQISTAKMHFNALLPDLLVEDNRVLYSVSEAECRKRAIKGAEHAHAAVELAQALLQPLMSPQEWQELAAQQLELGNIRKRLGLASITAGG